MVVYDEPMNSNRSRCWLSLRVNEISICHPIDKQLVR
jgi:hypothetical protein